MVVAHANVNKKGIGAHKNHPSRRSSLLDSGKQEPEDVRSENLTGYRRAHEKGARKTATLQKKIVVEKVSWVDRFVCLTDGDHPAITLSDRQQDNNCTDHHCIMIAPWMLPAWKHRLTRRGCTEVQDPGLEARGQSVPFDSLN